MSRRLYSGGQRPGKSEELHSVPSVRTPSVLGLVRGRGRARARARVRVRVRIRVRGRVRARARVRVTVALREKESVRGLP